MATQILIIGLGYFGMSLAKNLTEKGAEVLAVDSKTELVEEASEYVTEAIVIDATDEEELSRLHPGKRDVAVCAIGDDTSKESSIICTALLKQMGTPYIVARAYNKTHQRILQLVGANQIVNPEQEFGKRFANRLLYKNIIVDTPLGNDLQLTEISVQPFMIGKNLIELALPKKAGIMVVGIRKNGSKNVKQPNPMEVIEENDILVIVSPESSIAKLEKGK